MTKSFFILIIYPFFLLNLAFAEMSWEFQTEYDKFKITHKNKRFVIGNKEVNPAVFSKTRELIESLTEFDVECPNDKDLKPDVTVVFNNNGQKSNFSFFIKRKMIKGEEDCLYLTSGDLYEFPLHRSWFIGETNDSIKIENTLQVYQNEQLLFDFQKDQTDWHQKIGGKNINWEYYDKVLESFKDYSIDGRAHVDMGKEKVSFEIRNGRETFSFYLIGNNLWALKAPKTQWLVISSTWATFENFNINLWLSRYNNQLLQIEDKSSDFSTRRQALESIGSSWTKDIKYVFHRILLNPDNNEKMKFLILAKMKQKPTAENMKVIAQSLEQTENEELQMEMSKVLKIMNPKGPLIDLNHPDKIQEQIQFWQKWANDLNTK